MLQKQALTSTELKIFESVPDLYLILSPELYILTASDVYLAATLSTREQIIGKSIFEVFADNATLSQANAVTNLNASLQEVLISRKPHIIDVQGYAVSEIAYLNQGVEKKYWQVLNSPVLDEEGEICYIIHKISEVTQPIEVDAAPKLPGEGSKNVQRLHEQLSVNNETLTAIREKQHKAEKTLEELKIKPEERVLAKTNAQLLAQQAGEHQRQLLHSIFMDAPAPIAILQGENLQYQLVNPAYQQMFPGRELLNKPVLEALPELKGTHIEGIIHSVYSTGETFVGHEMPLMLARSDAGQLEEIYFTFTCQAHRDPYGAIDGLLIYAHDVTEHVKSRQKIEASERQLRLITDALPVLIGYLDKDEKYRFANRAYKDWFHQDPEALLGRPVREVVGEKAYQGVKQYIDRALAGERLDFEAAMPFRDDFMRYIRTSYVPDIQDGAVAGFYALINDVSEQVKSLQRLEESEEKYRSLFEAMDQGFCLLEMIFDADNKPLDYRFLEANPVFEKQTGLKDAIGKTARELVPNLEDHWFELYGKVALMGESMRFVEGSEAMGRWFDVFAYRMGGDESKKVALLFNDITERKKSERTLLQKNEQLEKINADLDNFIYTASHDLRAPIINIEGLMSLVYKSFSEERQKEEKIKALMGMINKSITSFKDTIKDLTEVAKVKSNGEEDTAEVSLAEMLGDVKLNIKSLIDDSKAIIQADFSEAPVINFSKKNLRSILYNLISNAIKYRSSDRQAVVQVSSSRPDSEHLLISVQDNGLGIEEKNKAKVFKMFTRLHLHVEGTGVGMSIVKKIVENNGGRIEIESEVGKGSLFKIYLKV